uniref:Uncharacterized protein n=1 Tax=mine drainage metagenome TaxID=410659 RepID=E6PYK8_9ZZZZ
MKGTGFSLRIKPNETNGALAL